MEKYVQPARCAAVPGDFVKYKGVDPKTKTNFSTMEAPVIDTQYKSGSQFFSHDQVTKIKRGEEFIDMNACGGLAGDIITSGDKDYPVSGTQYKVENLALESTGHKTSIETVDHTKIISMRKGAGLMPPEPPIPSNLVGQKINMQKNPMFYGNQTKPFRGGRKKTRRKRSKRRKTHRR